MKKCVCCGREYSGGITTCPIDGQPLIPFASSPPTPEQDLPAAPVAAAGTGNASELSLGQRSWLLAAAWCITSIASVVGSGINSARDFLEAALLFPITSVWLAIVPRPSPAIGWLIYISLTFAALFVRKRVPYFVLYALLCLLLLLNVVGCHMLPPGTHMMPMVLATGLEY